jgi:hypothetical protein
LVVLGRAVVRKLSLILLAMVGFVIVGCGDAGPNDPVVSGQDINKISQDSLPEGDKKMFDELAQSGAIPGEGSKK